MIPPTPLKGCKASSGISTCLNLEHFCASTRLELKCEPTCRGQAANWDASSGEDCRFWWCRRQREIKQRGDGNWTCWRLPWMKYCTLNWGDAPAATRRACQAVIWWWIHDLLADMPQSLAFHLLFDSCKPHSHCTVAIARSLSGHAKQRCHTPYVETC